MSQALPIADLLTTPVRRAVMERKLRDRIDPCLTNPPQVKPEVTMPVFRLLQSGACWTACSVVRREGSEGSAARAHLIRPSRG
jgi:hypothetical protein